MSDYFRQVPDFEYVSRLPDAKIGDYIRVKNLFKRGALESDILENLSFQTLSVSYTHLTLPTNREV